MKTAFAVCLIICITKSFFGFPLFGNSTMENVLATFDTNLGVPYRAVLNQIVHVTYVIHMIKVFRLSLAEACAFLRIFIAKGFV